MLKKTRGIVFRYTKYGDTSIIVTIFTEKFGLQSYIVNSVRSSTPKSKIALYQPLTLLDLVVYHRENAGLLRIKEVRCFYQYQSVHLDLRKSTISMFLSEVINRVVKEETHTEDIGEFLIEAFIALDKSASPENFHLIFLLKMSPFLGFGPQTLNEVLGAWLVSEGEEVLLKKLLRADFDAQISMTNVERRNLLEALLRFYSVHIDNFGELKSVNVLKEMFN